MKGKATNNPRGNKILRWKGKETNGIYIMNTIHH